MAGGFSLLEVLVGMALVVIAFVGTYFCIGQSVLMTQLTRDDLRATQILNEKMEIMRLYTWNQITNGTSVPTSFTNRSYTLGTNFEGIFYTGTVAFASPGTNYGNLTGAIRKVTVEVKWASQGSTNLRARQMATLVSSNGLQTYIY